MKLRKENIRKLSSDAYDVLILGGGINGAVAAAALAGKGLKTALIDKGDFAAVSSSNSSNLIWGGIKYMESGEYLLVNKLCRGRNHLMRHYPTSVKEVRFFATVNKNFRLPAFFVYLGAVLYWLIGGCFTKAPRYLSPSSIRKQEPIVDTSNAAGGLEYSDCYLPDNDARFVFNFIRAGMDYGCVAANYVEALGSKREQKSWQTSVRDNETGEEFTIRSKVLINACGPYVDHYNQLIGQKTEHHHLFSKGIHLIVDKLTDNKRVLAFFASDGRLFFVIPMGAKTCIGTTDTQVDSPISYVTDKDREFVLSNVNRLLKLDQPLTKKDIIAERCGVRPLAIKNGGKEIADWVKLSRKHEIDLNYEDQYLCIFGGKLTDCINVGEELSELIQKLGLKLTSPDKKWYGEPDLDKKAAFLRKAEKINLDQHTSSSSGEPLSQRLWRRYGERAEQLLDKIADDPTSAIKPIDEIDYIQCEVQLAAEAEMITKLEDYLRRRSKILHVMRESDILENPGLRKISKLLFADRAEEKLQEYIAGTAVPVSQLGVGCS